MRTFPCVIATLSAIVAVVGVAPTCAASAVLSETATAERNSASATSRIPHASSPSSSPSSREADALRAALSSGSFLNADGSFCYRCFANHRLAVRRRAEARRSHHWGRVAHERRLASAARRAASAHRSREAAMRRERVATNARAVRDAAEERRRAARHAAGARRALAGARRSARGAVAALARRRRAIAARRRAVARRAASQRCARRDCANPRVCYNAAGRRIASGRAAGAVRRGALWYRSAGSLEYWRGCRWVRSVARCHPTDPTIERHGTRWVKKAYARRRDFVRRGGVWYRSATSNMFWRNCRWVRRLAKRNCSNPSVRWVAGRWVKRSRAHLRKMRQVRGRWYLGRNRAFVYRNCRWVRSRRGTALRRARRFVRRQRRATKAQRKVSTWKRRFTNYLARDYARLAEKKPVKAAINKVTFQDMHEIVARSVPAVAARAERRFVRGFLDRYTPKGAEVNRPLQKRPGSAAQAVHKLLSSTNGEHAMFVDEWNPESNSNRENRGSIARQSTFDLLPRPPQWTEDTNDPERGISGDYEPGAQFRNEGKSAEEQLHVVGEHEMLRNPVEAQDQALKTVNVIADPSLSRV